MKKLNDLTIPEFMCVIQAKINEKDFLSWCKLHNIDYADATKYCR